MDGKPTEATFDNYQSTRKSGVATAFAIAGGQWVVDNESGLFSAHNHRNEAGGGNAAAGLVATLLPVEVKEVWSDQISGVEANGFPDKTGQKEYPYILIGATSGSTFKVKIKLASEIPTAIQSKILFRWAVTADSISHENGTSTFTDAKTVQLDSNANIGIGSRGLVMGYDGNSSGQLEASEVTGFLKTPHVQSGTSTTVPYKFIPISQTRYNDSKSELLGWAATAPNLGLREGTRHLTAFCNGSIPTFAGSEPTTIKRNESGLSHPVGVAFTPVSNPGDSFTAVISKDHGLSIKLIESNSLRSWMTGEFNLVGDAIRADIIAARQNGNPAQLLSYALPATVKSLGFGLSDPDLLVCLGRVTLQDPVVQFKVTMYGYVNDVKISGTAHDLYDFDYGGEEFLGYPARKASEVQAGFPSLGAGGKVFKTKIDLGGGNPYTNTDITPYTFFPN